MSGYYYYFVMLSYTRLNYEYSIFNMHWRVVMYTHALTRNGWNTFSIKIVF